MVDQKNSNNLLYLPLDKLIQSTNPGAVPSSGAQPAAKPETDQSKRMSAEEKDAAALRAPDTSLVRDRGERP
jgi:membrane protease subunit HflK